MNNESIIEYLNRLSLVSKESLKREYDLSMLDFKDFEYINTYLIHKTIEQGFNLHIKTCAKKENDTFYVPAIISVAIFGFIKNYIAYNPIPIIGEIIQKDKKRYTVAQVTHDRVVIVNKAEGNLRSDIPMSSYRKYIVTTAEKETDGRKLKTGFDHYRNFFNAIINGGIGSSMPSKFQHKYLIITSKEIFDALKKLHSRDLNIYKSLPVRYITSRGVAYDNIPIDPMIYIVNDYETAKEFVIGEQEIETVVVIGDSKYREYARNISQDIRASRTKNVIFIGSEAIDNFENLFRWNWTKSEQDILSNQPYYSSELRTVSNSNISSKIKEFQTIVEEIEEQCNISLLREFSDSIRQISRVIIPKSDSRLKNKVLIIKEEFRKIASEAIEIAFCDKGIYNSQEEQKRVITAFNNIADSVSSQKWREFEAVKKANCVVPKDYIDEINVLLRASTAKAIKYSELGKISGGSPKVCFFSVYGKMHFEECYLSDSFMPIFILYPHEAEYFKHLEKKYTEDIKRELLSENRFVLSGITYSSTVRYESIDDMMTRLFAEYDEDPKQESDRQERGDMSHILCRITFDNGDCENIESGKSVLLCNGNTSEIVSADKLRVGDEVRIYANANKERLWHIASSNDTKGLFNSIDIASQQWKRYLADYQKDNSLDSESLFIRLVSNGLTGVKSSSTIDRWLKIDSDTKFPKAKRNLFAMKITINSPEFDAQYNDILSKRRAYFSIMIGLGRDFSDEIIRYIQSNGKIVGEILSKYDDNVRQGFATANAPQRKITSITYIQDEASE